MPKFRTTFLSIPQAPDGSALQARAAANAALHRLGDTNVNRARKVATAAAREWCAANGVDDTLLVLIVAAIE